MDDRWALDGIGRIVHTLSISGRTNTPFARDKEEEHESKVCTGPWVTIDTTRQGQKPWKVDVEWRSKTATAAGRQ